MTEPRRLDPTDLVPIVTSAATTCDFCHRSIAQHETFHRVIVGLNEDGTSSASHVSAVEEVSELTICAACQPAVVGRVDALLAQLWDLRQPTPGEAPAPSPPAEPEPSALATPYGFTTPTILAAGREILAVAERAHSESPLGFALGVVIGQLIGQGLEREQIHQLVDVTFERLERKSAGATA